MSDQQDSKLEAKLQAYMEVLTESQKRLPELTTALHTKRGIAAGFKAAAETTLSQMRKVQSRIDDGSLDIDMGREVIAEMSQLTKALGDQGRAHELDCARLDGEVKNIGQQAQSMQALINKEKAKATRGQERSAQLDARGALQEGETPEDTGEAENEAPASSEANVTPISKAKQSPKPKKPARKKS